MLYMLLILLCSFIWAGVTIATKILSTQLPALAFAFIRYAIVVLSLLPFFIANKEYKRLKISDAPGLLLLGFLLVLMFNILFFNALSYTSATNVAVIGAINPIFMMFVNALFSQYRLNGWQALSFLLATLGTSLMITQGKMGYALFTGSVGELLTLLAVIFQTFYAIILRKVSMHYPPLFVTFATALSGILFLLPFIANQEFITVIAHLNEFQWLLFGFIGFLGSTISIFLYAFAMRHWGPVRSSMIAFTTMPIFTIILAHVILGETLRVSQVISTVLILASLILGLGTTTK